MKFESIIQIGCIVPPTIYSHWDPEINVSIARVFNGEQVNSPIPAIDCGTHPSIYNVNYTHLLYKHPVCYRGYND